jgi:hypothetical protein
MSITRFTSVLAAFVTALSLAPHVHAQLFKPFAFPPVESDFQFFAPADVDTYGGGPAPKTGWFADYARVYINVQRPDDAYRESDKMGDFTWGNRIDIGYVDDDQKGWVFTSWHIDGPNENVILLTERLNRYMTDASPEVAPIHPLRDNNLRLTGDRDYLVTNSVNTADLTGFELNRTWQLDQLHYGANLTPFVGLRYVKFKDFYQRDTYLRYDANGNLVPLTPYTFSPTNALTATAEELQTLEASVQNDMLGGQLGARWSKDYRRWNFSGDFKAFALENFQNWRQVTKSVTTVYSAGDTIPAVDVAPLAVLMTERGGGSSHNAEFVFGMELRFDAAYRLTRDISLRAGAEFFDFGQGIGRGDDVRNNNQDVIMYGFTMGVTWNR